MLLFILLSCVSVWSQVSGPGQPLTDSTIARLRNHIASGTVEEKRQALFEIRNYSSADASRIALPALNDKDEMVRATAASSVIFLPRAEAAGSLLPLLKDRAEFVRREAAYALGEVGDALATSSLVSLMQRDKVLEVRTAAAVALGKIGDASAVDSLVAILKVKPREDDEFLRRSAARSIGQIAQMAHTGGTDAVTPQNFLPEKYKDLRSGPTPPTLSAAIGVLTRVLENSAESDDTRREAAYALGAIGDTASRSVLQKNSTSSDPYLAEICREALLKMDRKMGS